MQGRAGSGIGGTHVIKIAMPATLIRQTQYWKNMWLFLLTVVVKGNVHWTRSKCLTIFLGTWGINLKIPLPTKVPGAVPWKIPNAKNSKRSPRNFVTMTVKITSLLFEQRGLLQTPKQVLVAWKILDPVSLINFTGWGLLIQKPTGLRQLQNNCSLCLYFFEQIWPHVEAQKKCTNS